MSKAEERALERLPVHEGASEEWIEMHLKGVCAEYIEGYHQAEKDLELTWKDMRDICSLAYNLSFPHKKQKEFYEEVLKRFKANKL